MSDGVGGFRFGTMPLFAGYPTVIAFPDDIYIVTVTFANAPADATPLSHAEGIVQSIRDNPSRVGVIDDPSEVILDSGLEAVHFSLSVPNSPTENYIFAIGEQMFHLAIQGNQSYAEHVLETLSATE